MASLTALKTDMFQYQKFDPKTSEATYQLDTSQLSDDECHFFFSPSRFTVDFQIMMLLEYNNFHPNDKKMNDRFHINALKVAGDADLLWCSFPKEYRTICEKAAATFEVRMVSNTGAILQLVPTPKTPLLREPEEKGAPKKEKPPKIGKDAMIRSEDAMNKRIVSIIFPPAHNLLNFSNRTSEKSAVSLEAIKIAAGSDATLGVD